MIKGVSVYFISDLHLQSPQDPSLMALVVFLRERMQSGDTLILAGDVFDLFVGGRTLFVERYKTVLDEIRCAGERGSVIHFIEGNHDFLLESVLGGWKNIVHHRRGFSLNLGDKRFWIEHGDEVDRKDYGYRLLRFFLRSWMMRMFIRFAPDFWIDWIGKKAAAASRTWGGPSETRLCQLRKLFRSHAATKLSQGFDYVVMGHCHDLDEYCFKIGDRTGQYINIGFPPMHGSLLSWQVGDSKIQRELLVNLAGK